MFKHFWVFLVKQNLFCFMHEPKPSPLLLLSNNSRDQSPFLGRLCLSGIHRVGPSVWSQSFSLFSLFLELFSLCFPHGVSSCVAGFLGHKAQLSFSFVYCLYRLLWDQLLIPGGQGSLEYGTWLHSSKTGWKTAHAGIPWLGSQRQGQHLCGMKKHVGMDLHVLILKNA